MSNEQIAIKEYDTVDISCQYAADDNSPVSISGINILADIKTYDGKVVESLIVNIINADTGKFSLTTESRHLAPNKYVIDVMFESKVTGKRISSDTFVLRVNPAVTKPRWQNG